MRENHKLVYKPGNIPALQNAAYRNLNCEDTLSVGIGLCDIII